MAALNNYNYDTRYAEFSVDNEGELVYLPTTTTPGSGPLASITDPVAEGSLAFTTSGEMDSYVLNSAGWVKNR